MLVQALEWMPLLERLDLVKVGAVSSNILKCMANVKPKLSIAIFGLAENELSFHDCEMIVKATSSMPYLRHLDLKNNKIGSAGCAALLPIKDYMEVIIDGNGVGEGLTDILKVACDQSDVPDHQHKTKPYINVGQNLTDLSAILPYIKDQLKSYSEDVNLDSDELLVNKLKFWKELCEITDVNLSYRYLGSSLGGRICIGMSNLPSLRHVDLSFNDIKDYGAFALSLAFEKKHLKLQYLDLSHNSIGDSGTKMLSAGIREMYELTQLNLSYNNITDRGAGYLGQAQIWMQNVTYLDLSHNSIGDKGAQSLGEGMGKISQLRHLDLGHNRIGDDGVVSLSEGFRRMTPCVLTYLDLSNNKISESDIKILMMAMHRICHVDLSNNQIIAFGVESFNIEDMSWEELRHLDLSKNNIGYLYAASLHLSYGIEKMMKLQHLNLSNNSIADYGAECLSVGMERIEELTHVNLSHNQIGPTGAGHLGEGIKTMYQLTHLDLSKNEISDTGATRFCKSFPEHSDQVD
ncbi:protein NLRC3-like [Ptychodera flava]|uniref:protein NLRC3-like n=1 Tax=Ptychodera flava TaxID=63121 RepID=UPI00396A795D